MPVFSRALEKTLRKALALANERRHEYATLEHLLLALIDDPDAAAVLRACNVDLDQLRKNVVQYLDTDLDNLVVDDDRRGEGDRRLPARHAARGDPRPVVGPRGSDGRQRAGGDLRRAREPRRLFPARAGHDPLRRGQLHQPRHRQAAGPVRPVAHAARRRRGRRRARVEGGQGRRRWQEEGRRARRLLRQPQQEGARRAHRSADRPRGRGPAHHPGAVPAAEEQSAAGRRSRRRQDGDRRRPGAQDRQRRGAGGARRRDRLRPRHGRAARRHPLSRRLRGAPEAGDEGDRAAQGRDPVHRRDPHRHRRRRDLGRRDGRLQPAQAGAGAGHAALHRLDHLQGIPPVFREGPRAGAPLPEDRRQRAERPGRDRDPQGPQALFRGVPQGPLHPTRRSRRRSSCRRATSTTASCPTRRST